MVDIIIHVVAVWGSRKWVLLGLALKSGVNVKKKHNRAQSGGVLNTGNNKKISKLINRLKTNLS